MRILLLPLYIVAAMALTIGLACNADSALADAAAGDGAEPAHAASATPDAPSHEAAPPAPVVHFDPSLFEDFGFEDVAREPGHEPDAPEPDEGPE